MKKIMKDDFNKYLLFKLEQTTMEILNKEVSSRETRIYIYDNLSTIFNFLFVQTFGIKVNASLYLINYYLEKHSYEELQYSGKHQDRATLSWDQSGELERR